MKILLTAFVPFNNDLINPSEEVLHKIDDKDIYKLLLPVSYIKAKKVLLPIIDSYKPDVIISLGYAAKRETITIEEYAYNKTSASIPDNDGNLLQDGIIIENSSDTLKSTINVDNIINELYEYNVEKSIDPGRFICNEVYYLSLYKNKCRAIFIHLPNMKCSINNLVVINKVIELIKMED